MTSDTPATRETSLPAAADRIGLRLTCCGPRLHPSHVEDCGADRLVVSAPLRHPLSASAALPLAGDAVVVGYRRGIEWMELLTTMTAAPEADDALWNLTIAAAPAPAERRAFTRIEEQGLVDLLPHAGTSAAPSGGAGRLLDLSEGGMRCVIQPTGALGVGEEIHVRFTIESDVVDATARVVRADRHDPTTLEVGLEFRSLPQPGTDRIRHHVSARSAS